MIKNRLHKISKRLLRSEPLQRCALHDCQAACCLYGVWLDQFEVQDILQHSPIIQPHLKKEYSNPEIWFEEIEEEDPHTPSGKVIHCKVVEDQDHYGGTACIFLRSDYKCALQVAGQENGFHPWRFKPFYCILHPLDLTEDGLITLDSNEELLQEPGSCLRPAQQLTPLIITFAPELKYLLGEKSYAQIVHQLEDLSSE